MPIRKVANAELKDNISLLHWDRMHGGRPLLAKTASRAAGAAGREILKQQSKYLLSHCTIMSSVMCEEPPYDYLIKPECSINVNNNHDAWENGVMRLSYRSFVGAFNFVEHYQNSKAAKGHILDAVLRKVAMAPGVWCYLVDILVATDLAHLDLVEDIRSGKLRYMSMGCVCDVCVCSFCGARTADALGYCEHLSRSKGDFLLDGDGVPRRVAELCGHRSLPNGGVKFVEASWVETPAYPGAVKRTTVVEEWVGPKSAYTRAASGPGIAKAASGAAAEAGTVGLGPFVAGDGGEDGGRQAARLRAMLARPARIRTRA